MAYLGLYIVSLMLVLAVAAGCVIRRMGHLACCLPFTHVVLLDASLALCGVPFTSGCESKDAVLELAGSRYVA
jgi:NADH:ubiquinone oxidoreductase subunit 5 (subunit L)/multisubunit Na+/H+ antiporter MnhA subunit